MTEQEKKEHRRNYYLKNRERELELMKIYRENNRDKIKEIRKNLKDSGYYKDYYKNNKEKILDYKRKYSKKLYEPYYNKHAIYLLVDKELEAIYVGSTSNIYRRIKKHMGGWSHLKLDKNRWEDLQASHWEYSYLDGIYDKQERLYIERYLIHKFDPILNEKNPINNTNIDELRKIELENIADGLVFNLWDK